MIKRGRQEARGLVAHAAIAVGGYMIDGFSDGGNTIVAGGTVVRDAPVIKAGAGKGRGVMAAAAILGGRNVWGAGNLLPGVFAGRRNTVTRVTACGA